MVKIDRMSGAEKRSNGVGEEGEGEERRNVRLNRRVEGGSQQSAVNARKLDDILSSIPSQLFCVFNGWLAMLE